MLGRQYTAKGQYRYGFNGKEKDDEIKGVGASYDYGFRIYDSRLGRFESTDPLSNSYPWFTPYQFSGNTPISAIDLDGLENIYIINNADNNGSCMEVVYTANDIATIIVGKRPEFKVHYENSKKTTDQFEGPNKANEAAVFKIAKPLLEKSGVTEYIKDAPTDDNVEFKSVKNNYEVPAPKPKKPKPALGTPHVDPPTVLPSLNIDFQGNADKFKNESHTEAVIKPLAEYLAKNPNAKITLFGNTGIVGDPSLPTGSGTEVTGSDAELNGSPSTTGKLMKARADAVKKVLTEKFKIDPKRVETATGTQTQGEGGRTVGVEVKVEKK